MTTLLALLDSIPLRRARTLFAGVSMEKIGKRAMVLGMVPVFSLGVNPFSFADIPAFRGITQAEQVAEVKEEVDPAVAREILWFARALYSESQISEEQLLVAWVIRNRVESTQYPDTYEEVVRAKGQFSGLHATDKQYWTNISLDYGDTSPAWDSALEIADAVYHASGTLRPLSKDVWHFYSPISVTRDPKWATGTLPVHIVKSETSNSIRFAFYAGIR